MTALLTVLAFAAAALAATLALLLVARSRQRELQSLLATREAELGGERAVREEEIAARAGLEARLQASEERHQGLQQTFAALSRQALDANSAHLVQLAEQVVRRAQETSQAELDKRARAVEELVRPVTESLGRVDEKIGKLEKSADVSAARLGEQVRALAAQEEKLRGETAKLATALRAPAQRGRWGETQLRRTLELAGLRAHVDFDEQPVAQLPDGLLRPDVAVRLPGEKTVLLDAKVPLEAYLKAIEAPEAERGPLLVAHAAQLRAHVDALSRKQY